MDAEALWAERQLTEELGCAVSYLVERGLGPPAPEPVPPLPAHVAALTDEDDRPWWWPSLWEPGSDDDPEGIRDAQKVMWQETAKLYAADRARHEEVACLVDFDPDERELFLTIRADIRGAMEAKQKRRRAAHEAAEAGKLAA